MIEPEEVARHIVDVVENDRAETFVPAWYRAGAIVQAIAPGLLGRLLARGSAYRRR